MVGDRSHDVSSFAFLPSSLICNRSIGSNLIQNYVHRHRDFDSSFAGTLQRNRDYDTAQYSLQMKRYLILFLLLATCCLGFTPRAPKPKLSSNLYVNSPLFSSGGRNNPKSQLADVVIDPDYTIATVFAITAATIFATNHEFSGVLGAAFHAYVAGLYAIQAARLRVIFDKDSFEFKKVASFIEPTKLKDAGSNFVVGGKNRWAYRSFVNWKFYPNFYFPLLVYFKETQTHKKDGSNGQIHFFPGVVNVRQLKEQFELRGCAHVD